MSNFFGYTLKPNFIHYNFLKQIIGAAVAASFHIVVGISLAYSAILLPQLNAKDSDLKVTVDEGSWIGKKPRKLINYFNFYAHLFIASVIVVIVPVGAMIGGFLMDSMGRLNTIKLAAIPGAIGWVLIAMATNVPMLIAGRLLTGLASGN